MFILPDLPYPHDALAPFVSGETMRTHHGKHHKTYVEKTNGLAAKAGLAGRPLEEVVREAHRRGDKGLFAYEIGLIHAALGQSDEAFRWLTQSVRERSGWIAYLPRDPRLAPLHADLRFEALHSALAQA